MTIEVDYLIIGAGLAGINAALRLSEQGRVWLISKCGLGECATSLAQGGIASVTAFSGNDDTLEKHAEDTLRAGAGLCQEEVVSSVVQAGPSAIARLVALGVKFDRELSPKEQMAAPYALTKEGGHSARRILHAQDVTGREIMRALEEHLSRSKVEFYPFYTAIDLLTSHKLATNPVWNAALGWTDSRLLEFQERSTDRCLGAYILNQQTGEICTVKARCTLLATGGAGKVYLYTTNPDKASGDGVALAFRAGARLANMEFYQFHPTCLYHPAARSFLLSEALRGEGGILRRADGEAFMATVHPLADLAPRDIVARAIDSEMKKSGADHVFLDMTACGAEFLQRRFPHIYQTCLELGIDIAKDQIPVVPAAHYMCGGVSTDLQARTTLSGLWAAGEVACTGLHGANRLASNSLLESVVFSERAALDMQAYVNNMDEVQVQLPAWDSGKARESQDMIIVAHDWDELRRTMWDYVGIVRSDKRLVKALQRIELLKAEIKEYYMDFKLTTDFLELRNLLVVAELTAICALQRRESRGLHYNIDVPDLTSELYNSWLGYRPGHILNLGGQGGLANLGVKDISWQKGIINHAAH